MSRSAPSYGPDCGICGCKEINVRHHPPELRADPSNPNSWPDPKQGGLDYYTWAGVEFHLFQAPDDGEQKV